MNDQTNVLKCSLLLNTAVGRRLVMITSGEEECQCLATWQHARAVPVKLLLPMHYVAKNELEPFLPSGPSQLSKRGCAYVCRPIRLKRRVVWQQVANSVKI